MHDPSLCTKHAKEAFYRRLNYGWLGAGQGEIELIVDRWEVITDRDFFGCIFYRQIFIRHDFRREPHYVASVCLQNIPLRGREAHTVPIKISFQLAGIPQRLSHLVAEITTNQLPLIYDPGRPRPRDGAPTLNRKLISGK